MPETLYRRIESPLGPLILAGDGTALTALLFSGGRQARPVDPQWTPAPAAFTEASLQLAAYFAGELKQFSLSLAPRGTAFRQLVWQGLQRIPFGRAMTYAALVAEIGRPKAVRAVGAANGANPLPIVIPCHRLVAGNGDLTGFGGGLEAKAFLLRLEGHRVTQRAARYRIDPEASGALRAHIRSPKAP